MPDFHNMHSLTYYIIAATRLPVTSSHLPTLLLIQGHCLLDFIELDPAHRQLTEPLVMEVSTR